MNVERISNQKFQAKAALLRATPRSTGPNPFAAKRDFRVPRNFANFRSRLAARPANKTRRGFEFSWCNRIRPERGELVRERTNDRRNSITALAAAERARERRSPYSSCIDCLPRIRHSTSNRAKIRFSFSPGHPRSIRNPCPADGSMGEVKRRGYRFERISFADGTALDEVSRVVWSQWRCLGRSFVFRQIRTFPWIRLRFSREGVVQLSLDLRLPLFPENAGRSACIQEVAEIFLFTTVPGNLEYTGILDFRSKTLTSILNNERSKLAAWNSPGEL